MEKIKTVDEASWKEVSYFDDLIQPILKLVKDNWDIKAAPKGYQEYRDQYEEYDDMSDEKFYLDFDGLLDTSASGSPINDKLSMPQVAYDDTQQGRDPLQTLIGAVLSYGIAIGKRQEQTNPNSKTKWKESVGIDIQRYLGDILQYNEDAELVKRSAEVVLDRFNHYYFTK